MKPQTEIYGLMAEFLTPRALLDATRRAHQAGYREMDAYSPYPIEGLAEELGMRRTRIPAIVLVGGIVGAAVGFLMQYWSMAIDYPFNVGGKPLDSWPAFIPITFEVLVLLAAFAALLGMLMLNGLPHPHHPVFNVPRFARASQDRFFLCIEAADPLFDRDATAAFLVGLAPHEEIIEVPHYQLIESPDIAEQHAAPASRQPQESAAG